MSYYYNIEIKNVIVPNIKILKLLSKHMDSVTNIDIDRNTNKILCDVKAKIAILETKNCDYVNIQYIKRKLILTINDMYCAHIFTFTTSIYSNVTYTIQKGTQRYEYKENRAR